MRLREWGVNVGCSWHGRCGDSFVRLGERRHNDSDATPYLRLCIGDGQRTAAVNLDIDDIDCLMSELAEARRELFEVKP